MKNTYRMDSKVFFGKQRREKREIIIHMSWVDLHDCVVDADEVGDEVEVSGDKNHEEENLGFPRDSRAAPCFPYLSMRRKLLSQCF